MKEHFRIFSLGFVLVVIGFIVAFQFVKPSPPKKISIATGSTSGAYFAYAKRYRTLLAEAGIELEIINTAGSIDNIQRLQKSEVDLAFVQSGTGQDYISNTDDITLVSLASVYYEPLWLFMSPNQQVSLLTDLQGKRIAIGGQGSGTQVMSRLLLKANGVDDNNATFSEISGGKAVTQLLSGGLDFVFLSSSVTAPLIQDLLREQRVTPFSFDRVAAYTRRYPFLSSTQLPRGVVDFKKDTPADNINLVSSTATVVARDDIHPALVALLMQIFEKVHSGGGILEESQQFPSRYYIDFPLSSSAERFFEHGPPLLQRYLPFWMAVLVNQLKVLLIPIIALMLPLAKILPFLYRWRVRSRIYRWYRDLRELEIEACDEELDHQRRQDLLAQLQEMHRDLMEESIPLSYHDELYHLRLHIEMVRDSLLKVELNRD